MGKKILYYVTGHGFGHARRSAAICAALLGREPGLEVHFRTALSPRVLASWLDPRVTVSRADFDPGAVERSPFEIDADRTAQAVRRSLDEADATVAAEAALVRAQRFRLIAADAPFLAGSIAAAAGVPCVAVTNFTWDWIYEPLLASAPDATELLSRIGDAYARMELLLRLPFSGGGATIPRHVEVPLVIAPQRRSREEVLCHIPLTAADPRPRVLLGQRGGLEVETVIRACMDAPEFLFVALEPPPSRAPDNLRHVPLGPELRFDELLRACDVVVSKLGWGIVTDCIASGTALLSPPRYGFREDLVSAAEAPAWARMRGISVVDFNRGRWRRDLEALLAAPEPPMTPALDGADVCAEWLLNTG